MPKLKEGAKIWRKRKERNMGDVVHKTKREFDSEMRII